MSRTQLSLFDDQRLTLEESIDLTIQSLRAYAERYQHWVIAFSGGKDSTTTATLIPWLIATGQIPAPTSLTVLYSDTRMEIPALQLGAMQLMEILRSQGIDAHVVCAPLNDRYFVYMLGRGVPPPNNQTLRWCTAQIKIEPMIAEQWTIAWQLNGPRVLALALAAHWGYGALALVLLRGIDKFLVLTGVRVGESAARDSRIALSCGKNGAECGQGWFQQSTPGSIADTLAPILHWRVCHVWDWLMLHAPLHGYPTALLAEVYGGDEAVEINARTGCIGCPLAERDTALDNLLEKPEWSYLAPLKQLKPLYRELRRFKHRKQKSGETNKDGRLSSNPNRKGPLTLEARAWALEEVLSIQATINQAADHLGRPRIDLVNAEEEARIRELIVLRTYPQKWSDADPDAIELIPQVYQVGHDVIEQRLLVTI